MMVFIESFKRVIKKNIKKNIIIIMFITFIMVPEVGLEPTWHSQTILSRSCLPISSLGHLLLLLYYTIKKLKKQLFF